MKIRLPALLAAAVVVSALGCASQAQAQTFYGPGGLFVHPSAFSPKPGSRSMAASIITQDSDHGSGQYVPVSLSFGLTERFSAGALLISHRGDAHPHDHGGVFAKYQLARDSASRPAFAVAGAYRRQDSMETSLAGVASHQFLGRSGRPLVVGHLGVKYGRHPSGRDDVGAYGGVEVPLGGDVRLVGELSTRLRFEESAARGLGLFWGKPGTVSVGLGMVNLGRGRRDGFFFGVGYPLGGGS
ncbi:MAG TPA: hypothetical protein VM490_00540 [Armatimonadaceae bacterium]|nr:hypothetical protein [Armatimonadaceae bacterium]